VGAEERHKSIGDIKCCHLDEWYRIGPGDTNSVFPPPLHVVEAKDFVDSLAGSGDEDDSNSRLVKQYDVLHQSGNPGVIYCRVVYMDNKRFATKPVRVGKHLPDEINLIDNLRAFHEW